MNEKEPKLGINQEVKESLAGEIIRLRAEVISKIDKRFLLSDALILFVKGLREKYPNWKNWLAYHKLVGSSPPESDEEEMVYEDFPGEDSVVLFLESLLDKRGR